MSSLIKHTQRSLNMTNASADPRNVYIVGSGRCRGNSFLNVAIACALTVGTKPDLTIFDELYGDIGEPIDMISEQEYKASTQLYHGPESRRKFPKPR